MRSTPPPQRSSVATGSRTPSSPSNATVKGFYLSALVRELASQGHHLTPAASYREFGDYPVAVAHTLLLDSAQRLYPHERRHEGLRRLGWTIYPTLLSTMVGRVIFGSLGQDLHAVVRAAGRGFEVSISEGRYEVIRIEGQFAQVRVRDFPLFPESFLVGVFEGAFAHYGIAQAKVSAHVLTPSDVDFDLSW
jgi:uncharacterized protein (TIGR02265 family)